MFSDSLSCRVEENVSLAAYSWLRIGGTARYFAEVSTKDDLSMLLADASASKLSVRTLGGGSNLLIREGTVDALVLKLSGDFAKIHCAGTSVTSGSAAALGDLLSVCAEHGLGGLEALAGIPGTVGAAVVSNSGVKNDDIGSRVQKVHAIMASGEAKTLTRDDLRFGYRRSNLEGAIITGIKLELEVQPVEEVTRRLQNAWIVKKATQPPVGDRVAQAFIEPSGTNIAQLLESAGMKGASEGSALMLTKYPGYLTINEDAKSDDVLALTSRIAKAVEVQTGIQLQPQLKIW
ncbi:MAG: UDP-N-acetylmuramate dehydrogenase [Aureliella sp.]